MNPIDRFSWPFQKDEKIDLLIKHIKTSLSFQTTSATQSLSLSFQLISISRMRYLTIVISLFLALSFFTNFTTTPPLSIPLIYSRLMVFFLNFIVHLVRSFVLLSVHNAHFCASGFAISPYTSPRCA